MRHNSPLGSGNLDKKNLWIAFKTRFETKNNKSLQLDPTGIINLKSLFCYFLKDEEFFKCVNLRGDLSKPSFDKGLFIIGSYGIGKSAYMKVMEEILYIYSSLRFKSYNAKELVHKFDSCQTPQDKDSYFYEMDRPILFIDDVNSENMASNFGKVEILEEIIFRRCEKKLKTHMSCNFSTSDLCVEQTLLDLGNRYGNRIYDRLFEMFNIVEFKGKSYR